jgi:hypothetical protein
MHTQQNTSNSQSLHFETTLRHDWRADLLREKAEIERRLRAIEAALNAVTDWHPKRSA